MRRCRIPVVLGGLLILMGCFQVEPPVTESVDLSFHPAGVSSIAVRVRIAGSQTKEGEEKSPLDERLDSVRRDLLEGRDDWSRRFLRAGPAMERFAWEKEDGELARVSHSGLFDETRKVTDFFADTPLSFSFVEGAGWAECRIHTSPPARITRDQDRKLRDFLDALAKDTALYFERCSSLYAYLDKHPDRVRVCFAKLFAAELSEEDREALQGDGPTEADEELLKPVEEAMERVASVLQVAPDEDHSADELSHLAYDPLPGTLTVRLPGPVLEVEGFQQGNEGKLWATGPGLWFALRALEGRWLSPDPLLSLVAHMRSRSDEPFALDAFLAKPRHTIHPPDPAVLRSEIEKRLVAAPLYRVRWSTEGLPGEPELPEDWGGPKAPAR